MEKLIITAALCGAGTTKAQTPYVPITPDEIAEDVVRVAKAGAAIAHIHVRDDAGKNTMSTERFVTVVEKVEAALEKEQLDVVLNLTTSGSAFSDEMRLAHLPVLKPEMCSFDPGSMNWANSYVFLNSPKFLETLGTLTQTLAVKPEIEIFDGGMIQNVNYYVRKGDLKPPLHYQFVLGVSGGMPGNVESLAYLLPKLQPNSTWSITGIGKSHLPMLLAGLAEGCNGLRVGLEDNIFLEKGVLATNAQLVTRAVKIAKLAGREIATAEEARQILGLRRRPNKTKDCIYET
ncbi:3-keto-5-aminohexanoate cleavage protein [Fusibacter paucivorans]|uniref:3-keto-5-aminohexanoate cleavage protein n=1 Tax=Fusibacter paucivorans TaxID=76009 RepID=A0ABS5PLK2_9FIRM|nr:3-keto-5-aminohexanoate cleavage protein [Fusibacter paucivorans]MBS7525274.1 3-keto-5-aminohexanoate cleavage protein [Fusibacter paucivorans]